MAQFSYEAYAQQQAAKKSNNQNGGGGQTPLAKTRFVNEWLKNDGDSVVVRFPYHSMDDIKFETTHTVTFPGERFGKRVRCEGADCPLCKQGVKIDVRFFLKAVVYVTDPTNGSVSLVPAIWDRPAAFADIDLKNLISEYGDLTESLFKIKRNGSGLDTRYTITIITNKAVYNPEVYKADFSGLENLEPARILTKSIEQYMKALNPDAAPVDKPQANAAAQAMMGTPEEEREIERVIDNEPKPQPTPVIENKPQEEPPAQTNRPKRYTF